MSDNEEWLRRLRVGTMAFIEQRIAAAKDSPADSKAAKQLPDMYRALRHFEHRINNQQPK